MKSETTILGACPRCGRELLRAFTPDGKVQFRCPSCGGRAVTLPTLRAALGTQGVGAILRAARAGGHAGCRCPECGADMALLKVGCDDAKIEIDVCPRCSTVWCDAGEHEILDPPPVTSAPPTMRELLAKASPEARERFQKAAEEEVPECIDPAGCDLEDVGLDALRLLFGAPTLWRNTRLTTPFFAVLLCLAIPVLHIVGCYRYGFSHGHAISLRPIYWGRPIYWVPSRQMEEQWGFSGIDNFASMLTAPFVQSSGNKALLLAAVLFFVFAVIERRCGHLRFLGLLVVLWASNMGAHILARALGWAQGYYCGFIPMSFGFFAFVLAAFPHVRLDMDFFGGDSSSDSRRRGTRLDLYVGIVLPFLTLFFVMQTASSSYLSMMLLPVAASILVGTVWGLIFTRKPRIRQTDKRKVAS